jgi:DNA-binding PadR family transcriptional regulator
MFGYHHSGEGHRARGRGHGRRGHDPRLEMAMQAHGFEMPGHHPMEGDFAVFAGGRDWRGGGPRGGWDRPGFGFGRGHGRPERLLEQGDLRWLVLDLIAAQPRHGYEVIKAIEEMLNGHYTPSPGVIYPTLTYLEETGLVTSEAQATKKLYSITEEGRAALEENAGALQTIRARIEETRGRLGGVFAPEMMRAMENLRTAIQVRMNKGEISSESLSAITAALDRAAGEIERS